MLKLGSSFPFNIGMLFLIWRELGMGKFPHSWLSSHSETEFLHSRLRRSWRNTLSLFLLSHSWGNFFFPPSWLRHSGRENPIPNSLQMRNSSFPGYILSMLMHATAWEHHLGSDGTLKWVLLLVAWLCLTLKRNVHSSALPLRVDLKG